jgi:hypothetical protein
MYRSVGIARPDVQDGKDNFMFPEIAFSEIKSRIKYGILPPWVIGLYKRIKSVNPKRRHLCRNNIKFRDIHQGRRCFILCNGPSINQQNLLPLKNEIVFSVSNGYYYKDYNAIRPRYHCVPRLSCNKRFTADVAIAWFKEMDKGIGDAELFLDAADEPLVRGNRLFPGRKINYLYMGISFSGKFRETIDISKLVPAPQSVPVMCLMIAMYMGFKKIYLIGTEHDSAATGEYRYFYTPRLLRGRDPFIGVDDKVKNLRLERQAIQDLMAQYAILKRIAENKGICIYNATLGGILEVYPRAELSEALNVSDAQSLISHGQ